MVKELPRITADDTGIEPAHRTPEPENLGAVQKKGGSGKPLVAAGGEPHRWNLGMPRHCQSSSSQPAAAREPGNDGCQVVRVDGLWHVDLEPSQQRQVCVVLLDERG